MNDWVAGDLMLLGWIFVRNGVGVNVEFERLLAHEFQALLLTS